MAKSNITGLDKEGTYRSLSGAASENIFIGRASAAGFFCFFKGWICRMMLSLTTKELCTGLR